MSKNLAKYRRFINMTQRDMAKVAGCCLTSYYMKESGNRDFTQTEIYNIFNVVKEKIPDITIEELFFN